MRGKSPIKREIAPDPMYGNIFVAKLINMIMRQGKKATAQKVVYGAFEIIKEKAKADPVEVLDNALKNCMPSLEVKSKRVGGANYQVPMPVRGERRYQLAYRWILEAANTKKARPMSEKLAEELMAAAKNEGDAVKKKLDVQRMAEANRAFAHFAR